MSIFKRLVKSFQILLQELLLLPSKLSRWLKHKTFSSHRGASRSQQAGFILPTVVMVILVVTLLTTTIVFRSFDRAKNASNVRVNQVTFNAALPAIERAKQKLDAAFSDPTLPRGTPADGAINTVLLKPKYTLGDEVRLQLAVDFKNASGAVPIPAGDGIDPSEDQGIELSEVMRTAWRYPVDTDGNGRFDSFTLYGIYFRSPNRATSGPDVGTYARERIPLDSRTPPQDDGSTSSTCAEALGTSASLVDAQGWFKSGDKLKKSFYVYTTTIPIIDRNADNVLPLGANPDDYENFVGNRGFTALEYQQDRVRIPLGNNAIVYEDDLDLFTGPELRINGRVVVNSNLLAAERDGLSFFQVSSVYSCFYEAENAKIIIGGNVVNGTLGGNLAGPIDVDLYKGKGVTAGVVGASKITGAQQSTNNLPIAVAYNSQAYEERIAQLVQEAQAVALPEAVKDEIISLTTSTTNPISTSEATQKALEVWFRNRTRRVPFAEVPFGDPGVSNPSAPHLVGSGDSLRPINTWHFPNNGASSTGLNVLDDKLDATDPNVLQETEERIGDRVLVGNNLPAVWDDGTGSFADEKTPNFANPFIGVNTGWTNSPGGSRRYRLTRVQQLVDLGLTERDGFWETSAAELPKNPLDGVGGLRVVTGAGVYLPPDRTQGILNNLTNNTISRVVWPDSMPMIPQASDPAVNPTPMPEWMSDRDGDGTPDPPVDDNGLPRPFLKMRASVVYHYTHDPNALINKPPSPPDPIACVSSYYDPTDSTTARNRIPAGNSGELAWEGSPIPRVPIPGSSPQSNNGITYGPPTIDGLTVVANDPELAFQAGLIYPDGRLVNPRLAKALATGSADRTLADRAAIDSTLCALQILGIRGNPGGVPGGYNLPNGAIQEVSFLNARELKTIEGHTYNRGDGNSGAPQDFNTNDYDFQPESGGRSDTTLYPTVAERISQYDLAIELREPLEIRATVLDLDLLRSASALSLTELSNTGPTSEWMLPDSGIIYATRDDALPDISDKPGNPNSNSNLTAPTTLYQNELASDRLSASDFWLDPTRRPGGILLINGSRLTRDDNNDFFGRQPELEEEKGLILASNLPIYIKAQNKAGGFGFNLHDFEEFTTSLALDTYGNFYSRQNLDPNFACRKGDNRVPCPTGDNWRPAAILGDSLTLLSDRFRFGFRNEGDYDLRNNQTDNLFRNIVDPAQIYPNGFPNHNIPMPRGLLQESDITAPINANARAAVETNIDKRRRDNGFWDNTFVTNGLSSENDRNAFGTGGTTYNDLTYSSNTAVDQVFNSSYFNNYVTPIQRRKNAPEYLMEMCRKLPISECTPGDWVIGYDANNDGDLVDIANRLQGDPLNETNSFVSPVDINGDGDRVDVYNAVTEPNLVESKITSEQILRIIAQGGTVDINRLGAGTVASPPRDPIDQHYARRVAFKRNYGNLEFVDVGNNGSNRVPIPLGIDTTNQIASFEYKASATGGAPVGDPGQGLATLATPFTVDGPVGYNLRPREVANALWFRGSDRDNGQLWTAQENDDYTQINRWLSYERPEPPNLNSNANRRIAYKSGFFDERDNWKLPDISTSVANLGIAGIREALNKLNGFDVLNGIPPLVDNNPVDFSLCIQSSNSRNARFMSDPGFNIQNNCGARNNVTNAIVDFRNLAGTVYSIPVNGIDPVETTEMLSLPRTGENPLAANTSVYVYEFDTADIIEQANAGNVPPETVFNFIGSNEPVNNPASLTLNGDQDTIFVFRAQSANQARPLLFQNFNLVLNGVNPNNVFWISEGGMTFAGNNRLAGNFLSSGLLRFDGPVGSQIPKRDAINPATPVYITSDTVINGGRFLGFDGTGDANYFSVSQAIDVAAAPAELTFKGITTSHQPLVVPVLQLPLPSGTGKPFDVETTGEWAHHWLPVPPRTRDNLDRGTFNLVMAVGDTPNRYRAAPIVQETNGGLGNFPRFLERWWLGDDPNDPEPVVIRGSFIQLQRSAYSTGPFWQLLNRIQPSDDINKGNGGSFFTYAQRYSVNGTRNHTYGAPNRLWGFDVGVLSQLPDLFSQRFTLPPTDDPNEYYREVSRDDDWIRTLLCAVQMPKENSPVEENVKLDRKAVNTNQRPEDYCSTVSQQ